MSAGKRYDPGQTISANELDQRLTGLSSQQIKIKTLIDKKLTQTREQYQLAASHVPLQTDATMYPWHMDNSRDVQQFSYFPITTNRIEEKLSSRKSGEMKTILSSTKQHILQVNQNSMSIGANTNTDEEDGKSPNTMNFVSEDLRSSKNTKIIEEADHSKHSALGQDSTFTVFDN